MQYKILPGLISPLNPNPTFQQLQQAQDASQAIRIATTANNKIFVPPRKAPPTYLPSIFVGNQQIVAGYGAPPSATALVTLANAPAPVVSAAPRSIHPHTTFGVGNSVSSALRQRTSRYSL